MKLTLINVLTTFLCATGVAVVASCSIPILLPDTVHAEKQAQKIAAAIAKGRTIPEYTPKAPHSSVVKMTTKVLKVTTKAVASKDQNGCGCKPTVYVANPIYPAFTNALACQAAEIAEMAKNGDVTLKNGFALSAKDGQPTFKLPEAYSQIVIGGVAMGGELKDENFALHTTNKDVEGTEQKVIDTITLATSRRLAEPEFYCTDVTYSILPATRQVCAIRMGGNLSVKNAKKAWKMVREIKKWLREDYKATDLFVDQPSDTVAYKKFRIGKQMEVEVSVKWNKERTDEKGNAHIDISFVPGELSEENQYECQQLGQATDAARVSVLKATGVNYYTISPTVKEDAVKSKVVY